MNVDLLYGRKTLTVRLPDDLRVTVIGKPLRVGTVKLYTTGLGKEGLKDAFVDPVPSVEAAVAESVKAHGDPDIAVVPEGPYVIPLYSAP